MKFTAQQIAELLKGSVEGNPQVEVSGLSKIEEGKPGTLSFLANPKYNAYIYTTKASIVIVNSAFEAENPVEATLIRVADAYKSFASLLEIYNQIVNDKKGIEQPSFIDPSATIGKDVYIGAFAYIGKNSVVGDGVKIYPQCYVGDNVVIKDNTTLFAGCRVYSFCQIGKECNLHAGVIIGADGFGFAPNEQNNYKKVPQIGNVIIEDYVEVGAGTTIDRATLGSTIIRKGVKLDNLIQIAHNVEIGENTVIAAQTGVAGSTKIGKNCMIGGQVGIVGHLSIADGVKIAAQSGIGTSITTEGEIVQGSPAFNISDYKRTYVVFKKLPQLERKINELEKAQVNKTAE
ncbi:MAG TPA: UDP-3-O-(3-hydroxymyristoyl)glucosamine N-acyltransferase [Bacteroidia bacterium]|nr:MAG: UDP-3-O-(3-hydroxymyristoyl) glucosamine N- acyltransferase [Bacteroidetes bacterium OLB10]MBX3105301.1 UDP-3-O-(3-hydroxymyristoyl)glucosamine N-acyltransferase [Bacteroidota bacterium]MCB8930948.1 UDP-3-O-(3-hydroxymyristoyl)glucosamine N-acyltransferase [Bacteroidia bacterium]MCB0849275.1 UDP-3-O-(3-hydroxymyristoyl)glucosamine N-acyltransferase [Bacteroidota bacterium]MCO5289362.1 UDP-3-O-(3-hydroxymyristoyl)glucosamine N-acyltransferase [Bacteroidota bacterium]